MDPRAERDDNKQKNLHSKGSSIGITSTQQRGRATAAPLTPTQTRPDRQRPGPPKRAALATWKGKSKQRHLIATGIRPSHPPSQIGSAAAREYPAASASTAATSCSTSLQRIQHPTSNIQHPASSILHSGHLPCASRSPSVFLSDARYDLLAPPQTSSLQPGLPTWSGYLAVTCPTYYSLTPSPCRAAATAAWLPGLSTDGDWGTI